MQIIKKYSVQIGIVVVFLILVSIYLIQNNQNIETLSKLGSRGEEVRQIQKILQGYGVYNGKVDGIYGSKIKLLRVLVISSLLCICSYLLASLSQNAMIALIGCALCGLSVSLMWPGMLSFASGEFKTGGTAMFGIMAVFGDMGCSVGPWVIGFVSEFTIATGEAQALRYGVLAAAIFPIVMLIGTLVLQKKKFNEINF